jgi:WD40 repeat protein
VFALVFSPDAKNLLSGGSDHIMRCWDVHTGREVGHLDGHAGSIRGLAISPDGHYIASCGDDRTVHLWKQEKM